MAPLHTEHTTQVLGAPAGWDQTNPPCVGLPVYLGGDETGTPYLQSWWTPTRDELERLMASASPIICLTVWGTQHPPIALDVV